MRQHVPSVSSERPAASAPVEPAAPTESVTPTGQFEQPVRFGRSDRPSQPGQPGQSVERGSARGHVLALATVLLWGVTFVSTKVLLEGLSPLEILVLRFCIGYVALWLIRPRVLNAGGWRDEALFAAAGICGVTLSFLMENTALTMTTASNVGVIMAASPLFTGLVASWVLREGRLGGRFFLGFVLAISGIALISFSGGDAGSAAGGAVGAAGGGSASGADAGFIGAGALGCALAVCTAIMSAVYSNISKRISMRGYDPILITRRIFFWGLVAMVPCMPLLGFSPDWAFLARPVPLANLLFLGLGASATCYAMWNTALKELGPVKTMTYQYLVPVVTIAIAVAALGEPLTPAILAGAALTIGGLVVSQT